MHEQSRCAEQRHPEGGNSSPQRGLLPTGPYIKAVHMLCGNRRRRSGRRGSMARKEGWEIKWSRKSEEKNTRENWDSTRPQTSDANKAHLPFGVGLQQPKMSTNFFPQWALIQNDTIAVSQYWRIARRGPLTKPCKNTKASLRALKNRVKEATSWNKNPSRTKK